MRREYKNATDLTCTLQENSEILKWESSAHFHTNQIHKEKVLLVVIRNLNLERSNRKYKEKSWYLVMPRNKK